MIVLPHAFKLLRPIYHKNTPNNFSAPIHKKNHKNVRQSQLRLSEVQKNRNISKKVSKKIETL
jgi:hypothetical protein